MPALRRAKGSSSVGQPSCHHVEKERMTESRPESVVQFKDFSFGSLRIDGNTYRHDVIID